MGPRKVGPPRKVGGPKFRAFSSLSRHRFAVSVSLWGSSRGILVEHNNTTTTQDNNTKQQHLKIAPKHLNTEIGQSRFGQNRSRPQLAKVGLAKIGLAKIGHDHFVQHRWRWPVLLAMSTYTLNAGIIFESLLGFCLITANSFGGNYQDGRATRSETMCDSQFRISTVLKKSIEHRFFGRRPHGQVGFANFRCSTLSDAHGFQRVPRVPSSRSDT